MDSLQAHRARSDQSGRELGKAWGWVDTKMGETFVSADAMNYIPAQFARVLIQRPVGDEEVAGAVVFLAGLGTSAISGIDVLVDCGTFSNLYVFETLPK